MVPATDAGAPIKYDPQDGKKSCIKSFGFLAAQRVARRSLSQAGCLTYHLHLLVRLDPDVGNGWSDEVRVITIIVSDPSKIIDTGLAAAYRSVPLSGGERNDTTLAVNPSGSSHEACD
jgi:hypothetical protein